MPQIGTRIKTHRIYFPSTINEANEEDKAWADIKEAFGVGDYILINKDVDPLEKAVSGITALIVDWNVTKADGSPQEITREFIKTLGEDDFEVLANEATAVKNKSNEVVADDEKKTLSDTSQPAVAEAVQI